MPAVSHLYNYVITFPDVKIGTPYGLLLVEVIPSAAIIWVAQSKVSPQSLVTLIVSSNSTDAALCTLQMLEEIPARDLHVFHCRGRGYAYDCHQGNSCFSE